MNDTRSDRIGEVTKARDTLRAKVERIGRENGFDHEDCVAAQRDLATAEHVLDSIKNEQD